MFLGLPIFDLSPDQPMFTVLLHLDSCPRCAFLAVQMSASLVVQFGYGCSRRGVGTLFLSRTSDVTLATTTGA